MDSRDQIRRLSLALHAAGWKSDALDAQSARLDAPLYDGCPSGRRVAGGNGDSRWRDRCANGKRSEQLSSIAELAEGHRIAAACLLRFRSALSRRRKSGSVAAR